MNDEPRKDRSNAALTCFIILAAIALFYMVYLPARWQREQLDTELQTATERQQLQQSRAQLLQQKCELLEHQDPDAMEEAVREVLRKGKNNEFVLRQPTATPKQE